ncbi:MAG TPA: EAL domain-containing protein [Frankiaceae bacterium]|nr:EAL domain-containing protein [Frankiaceae bacterium]
MTFGTVSLALALGLGVVLSLQIDRTINQHSERALKNVTTSAVAVAAQVIIADFPAAADRAPTPAEQVHQVKLMNTAATVLRESGSSVAAEALLTNGYVIAGTGADAAGTTASMGPGFRDALRGLVVTKVLRRNQPGEASAVENRLLARNGDLLEVEMGFRLSSTSPVLLVVRTYASMAETQRQATSDIRRTITVLAAGLLVFWACLFRLVAGASRALTRQSRDNAYLATHDTLTGLPNRALLRDRAEQAITASRRSGGHVGLLLLDLDRFKEINDTLGHRYGDTLLKQVGPRLREHLRDTDTVARLGGDEFVVLLPDLRSGLVAVEVAEKLVEVLQQPFLIDGAAVDVGCSVGVALTPDHGEDFDLLLQHTDVAMYVAKKDSLGVVSYALGLDSHSPERLALLGGLRRAVEDCDQIVVHYQPKASLRSGRVTGVEALVRWQHPEHGLIAPNDFIPLAERTGIIRPLTWCILRKALEQNRRWADDGLVLRVAVNISARCLLDKAFPEEVGRILRETGVPAERLELELTESSVMSDPDRALAILQALRKTGIRLAIDDFGTGYSSMAYLKKLPVSEIKIDRTFVTEMDSDASDAAIVRSSLELARNLDLEVVAEGIETQAVWDLLTDLGCSSAQGFFLSRPLPPAQFESWLRQRETSKVFAAQA